VAQFYETIVANVAEWTRALTALRDKIPSDDDLATADTAALSLEIQEDVAK